MRDITQEYSSLTEYAVRILDIVIIFALAHSAALLRLSVPLNTLSNSHLIVTYFCAALALPMLPRFEFRMLSHNHPFAVTFCQMAASLSLIIGVGVLFVSLTQPNHSLSWTWIATWYLLSVASITFIHLLIRTCMQSLREHGYNQRRVIIIGYLIDVIVIDNRITKYTNPQVSCTLNGIALNNMATSLLKNYGAL